MPGGMSAIDHRKSNTSIYKMFVSLYMLFAFLQDVKNISEPEEIQKKILSPDDIRERLQSLGTFKAIPDGDKIETRVIVEEKKVRRI